MSARRNRGGDDTGDGVNLLTSILVRYPEVATVNFDPEQQLLTFTFILSRPLTDDDLAALREKLLASIDVYNWLEGRQVRHATVTQIPGAELSRVEVRRDVESLEREEISVIVEIFRQYLRKDLVTEANEPLAGEDVLFQEEVIDQSLHGLKEAGEGRVVYAFRDEGRVLVFDK